MSLLALEVCGLLFGLIAAGQAESPLDAVAQAMPHSNSHFGADYPAAARCQDGAVWLFWGQNGQPGYFDRIPLKERESHPEFGMFCKCIGADGTVIVPPTRLEPPVLAPYTNMPFSSRSYIPIAQSNGSVVVIFCNMRNSTLVIRIDREGGVKRTAIDDYVDCDRGKRGQPLTAAFWSWFNSAVDLRCIYHQHGDLVRNTTVRVSESGVELLEPRGMFYPAEGVAESTWFANNDTRHVAVRRNLVWTKVGWDYSGVAPIGEDTLLVVHIQPIRCSISPWRGQIPSDTMTVYRLRSNDLSMIDSVRCNARLISGNDMPGVKVSRAMLQKTTGGYTFVIAGQKGTTSYQLDPTGKPVFGTRTDADFGSMKDYDGTGEQLLTVLEPDMAVLKQREIHWFALTTSGKLCHEMTAASP